MRQRMNAPAGMTANVSLQRLHRRSRLLATSTCPSHQFPPTLLNLFRTPASGIVVCDMTDCKCLISTVAAPADLSQMVENGRSKAGQKNGPANRGQRSKVRE